MTVRLATPEERQDLGPVARPATPEELAGLSPEVGRIQAEQRQIATQGVPTVGEAVIGGLETAGTMATGAAAMPLAGLGALGTGVAAAVRGDDDVLAQMVEKVNEIEERFTFRPRTEAGQQITGKVGEVFQFIEEGATRAGETVGGAGFRGDPASGSPALATATKTAIEALPGALGLRIRSPRVSGDIARVTKEAKEIGLDLGAKPAKKTEQIQAAAERETAGATSRSEAALAVAEAVRSARQAAREHRDALYADARATNASIPIREMRELPGTARQALKDFDVEAMPIVRRRLKELDAITGFGETGAIKLNAIEAFRQRLTRNRPASTDLTQAAALDTLKGQIDDFIQAKFESDMIRGDPSAIAKWQRAREAHKLYRETFSADRTIRNLAEQQATPEEMWRWIFGASVTGASKQAGGTIRRLKEIIGEDSPQFRALRQGALLDLMEPLLRETPDFRAFVKNYDSVFRKNQTLLKELFPESETALRKLRDFAKITKVEKAPLKAATLTSSALDRIAAVAMFGHGLAKRSLIVSLATRLFGVVRRIPDQRRRRDAIADVLGYDAAKPVVTITTLLPAAGEATQEVTSQ